MNYDWLRHLSAAQSSTPLTSLGTRRRAQSAVGNTAMEWGIDAGHRMADYILGTLPGWPGDRSEEEVEALRRATEASTLDTLTALSTHEPALLGESNEPKENVWFYVHENIPLEDVIRNVHTGQEFLVQELIGCISELVPPDDRLEAIKRTTRDVIRTWSVFSQSVSQSYAALAERWLNSADAGRANALRNILDGLRYSPERASRELNYDVSGKHLAVTLWLSGVDADTSRLFDFPRVAKEIARSLHSTQEPLLVPRGVGRADLWVAEPDRRSLDELNLQLAFPAALFGATGEIETGLEGFAATFTQARAAKNVAQFDNDAPTITRYADVELVALLAADTPRAQRFVESTLGALRQDSVRMAELRITLATYIDCGSSLAQTAQLLHTHRNTISYRLNQIDGIVPTGQSRTALRCALELAKKAPRLVLAPGEL